MRPAQQISVPMLRVPSAECVCTTTTVRADACERHAPEHFFGSAFECFTVWVLFVDLAQRSWRLVSIS